MIEEIQDGDEKDLLVEYLYSNYSLTLNQTKYLCKIFSFDKDKITKFLEIISRPLSPKYDFQTKKTTLKELMTETEKTIKETELIEEFFNNGGEFDILKIMGEKLKND